LQNNEKTAKDKTHSRGFMCMEWSRWYMSSGKWLLHVQTFWYLLVTGLQALDCYRWWEFPSHLCQLVGYLAVVHFDISLSHVIALSSHISQLS
jgi:hypothetical protein